MKLPGINYYYTPTASVWKGEQDTDGRDRIEQIVCDFPGYGYRRMTKRLHSSIGYVPPKEFEASGIVKDRNEKTELLSAITN